MILPTYLDYLHSLVVLSSSIFYFSVTTSTVTLDSDRGFDLASQTLLVQVLSWRVTVKSFLSKLSDS